MEETRDGVNQHGVGSSGVETAGFFEGQDPLHPAIALVTGRPSERLRHSTPKRKARSARLLVGSTPCWARKTHRESISRSRRRAKRPASSVRAQYWSISLQSRAYHARHSPPVGGAVAI